MSVAVPAVPMSVDAGASVKAGRVAMGVAGTAVTSIPAGCCVVSAAAEVAGGCMPASADVAARGMSAEQAALRIAAQRPAEEKIRHATAVLTNNATPDALAEQVEAAWKTTVQPHLGASR